MSDTIKVQFPETGGDGPRGPGVIWDEAAPDGAPGAEDGLLGDVWFQFVSDNIHVWGPKTASGWGGAATVSLRGPQGIGVTGPAPQHEWSGFEIRFRNPDGSWGAWTNLRGAPGEGEKGDPGYRGWSPVLVPVEVEVDSQTVILYRLIAWIGGQGDAPTAHVGQYANAAGDGFTADPAEALKGNEFIPSAATLSIGEHRAFWRQDPPDGWLVEDGAALERALYPDLDAAIYVGDALNATAEWGYRASDQGDPDANRSTTGDYIVLPDTQGEFLRGHGPGRDWASHQGDAIRNIQGSFITRRRSNNGLLVSDHAGVFDISAPGDDAPTAENSFTQHFPGQTNFNASNVVPTADENRPRNLAPLFCIYVGVLAA